MSAHRRRPPAAERIQRYRRGHISEWLAAVALIARGYRILARRVRTPWGEIDLIAVRGRRIAFVEVKARAGRSEAEAALRSGDVARMRRAAAGWLARNRAYADHDLGFDAMLVLPWRWPIHLVDGLQG